MRELKGDQPIAFEEIVQFINSDNSLHLLQGYAGTGKTFLMSEVAHFIRMKGVSLLVTAPTHKAVKVLRRLVGSLYQYSTIHAALGMKESIDDHGKVSFKNDPKLGYPAEKYQIIIVDEASMLDDVIFIELMNLQEKGKKILFVGDPLQIPPVNHAYSKPFLKSVQEEFKIGVSTLKEIIRQEVGNPIIENAFVIRGSIKESSQILKRQEVKNEIGAVFMVKKKQMTIFVNEILPLFKTEHYRDNSDFVKVIAWRNDVVNMYNNFIRGAIYEDYPGELPKIMVGDRLIADAPITEGGMTLINTNDEVEVLSTETALDTSIGEGYELKYYNTRVRLLDIDGIYNEFMIRIIHEDSEAKLKKLLDLQKLVAKSHPFGSFQARSAWMDYYKFLAHWHRVKYSYCITAHKSQGSTYHTAYVLEWDIMTNRDVFERNRIFYTSCTRPSKNLYIEY